MDPCPEIKTLPELYNTIFENDYKKHSMWFDLPSNSQILAHIAFEAGIQAIKYPSKFTGEICLSEDRNSKVMQWLTRALIFVGLLQAISMIIQALK